ncbi:hypothetical protein KCMC57_up41080 [Kitasatospora sp. CMC57]|uniref:Uncharacterized protein n=1 Tax=Kitasatospora sp. CMC57 TaxID=3231513 RepID=A0AB33JYN5_9ACTN
MLGELDLLAAEGGKREVGDLEVTGEVGRHAVVLLAAWDGSGLSYGCAQWQDARRLGVLLLRHNPSEDLSPSTDPARVHRTPSIDRHQQRRLALLTNLHRRRDRTGFVRTDSAGTGAPGPTVRQCEGPPGVAARSGPWASLSAL